jgi:hypothetical protein
LKHNKWKVFIATAVRFLGISPARHWHDTTSFSPRLRIELQLEEDIDYSEKIGNVSTLRN